MASSNVDIAALVVQLASVFVPIVQKIIADHQAANDGAMPTDEEIIAKFEADIDQYLAEGAAWNVTHPDPDAEPETPTRRE
jgi:hypothetical protein